MVRQQFWKCDRTININKQPASDMEQLSDLDNWNQKGYEYEIFIASCTDKEYIYRSHIATNKLTTSMTTNQSSDWLGSGWCWDLWILGSRGFFWVQLQSSFSKLIVTCRLCIIYVKKGNSMYRIWFKGLRPVLEGFVVPMHEGVCETGSQIPRALARGIWRTVRTSPSALGHQTPTDRS